MTSDTPFTMVTLDFKDTTAKSTFFDSGAQVPFKVNVLIFKVSLHEDAVLLSYSAV